MQKKSLLVALFCGALCLTGCLKNEESASVALVRGAKAEELKSLAALNNAKAAAEAVYAQAELTVAQAEAKLREANANLVNAQAETEKVRAELLKVRVALAEVKVDEEKVRLQKMEAELEQKLAEVEAAIATAEAEKQKQINEIEHQVALAEKQALADALEILKAEDALQKYVLTQEGAKADSAKAAGVKYFAALDEIQELQLKSIRTKAEKALVEAGAIGIRGAIHFQMEQIEEEIAEKEAIVAYLKEHQGMTPEEAEAALKEARTELDAAFNAYAEALTAENDAKGAYQALAYKHSLFTRDWSTSAEDGFADFIENNWGFYSRVRHTDGRQAPAGRRPHRVWTSYVVPQNFIDYEDYAAVTYYGYADPADPTKFIKLWKYEQLGDEYTNSVLMYPEKTVDWIFPMYDEMVIAPAEIYYDNIEAVLDSIADRKKVQIEKDVKAAEEASAKKVEGWKATIAENKEELALIKEYVDARKDTVEKAETALAQLVEAYNNGQVKKNSAQEAYYEYMLVNYNVSRDYFEAEIEAAKDTADAGAAYRTAKANLEAMVAAIPGFKTDSTNKKKAMDDAAADLAEAKRIADLIWTEEAESRYNAALAKYNPEFAYTHSTTKISTGATTHADTTLWFYKVTKNGGSDQMNWLAATDNEEVKLAKWNAAKAALAADPTSEALINAEAAAHVAYTTAATATIEAQRNMRLAEINTEAEQAKYDVVFADVEEAEEAYNKAFENNKYNDGHVHYDKTKKNWFKKDGEETLIAGTTQADWFMADSVLTEAKKQVKAGDDPENPTLKDLEVAAYADYKGENPDGEWTEWKKAYDALVAQFAARETEKYKNDSKVAELYEAWQKEIKDAATATTYETKLAELRHLYNINVAPDTPYTTTAHFNQPNGYSWLVSNYHLNPEYEFVAYVATENGKKVIKKRTVASLLFNRSTDHSLTAINADLTEDIANEPEALKEQIAEIREGDKQLKADIADVKTALNQYKAYESEYKTWVADREKAFKAWQDTRKDSYEAMVDEFEAKNAYDATEALANGGMWVYDPDWTIWNKVYTTEAERNAAIKAGYRNFQQGFSFIPVNKAIEQLEGGVNAYKTGVSALSEIVDAIQEDKIDKVFDDKKVTIDELQSAYDVLMDIDGELPDGSIAELNFTKALLQGALKVGKVTLQVVLDAFDAELAVIDEKIALQTKVAAVYKAIMNGWLGIVDDEDVEGETGPLDGEGDDEE